jgi:hypothetical protein
MSTEKTKKIPEGLNDIYESLWRELVWLHSQWQTFYQLYAVNKEQVQFLNDKAPAFFRTIQDSLVQAIFMSLSRLTDPLRTGKKENLSLMRLLEHIDPSQESEFRNNVTGQLNSILDHCAPFREWRNRGFAHNDLPTALKFHPDPLPEIGKEVVEEALRMMRNLMNSIQGHYENGETAYDNIIERGGAEDIVFYLQEAEKHRICEREARARKYRLKDFAPEGAA